MNNAKHDRNKGYGRNAVIGIAALLGAGVLILWGWNALAVDLFGAPAAKFKHALALEAIAAGLWLAARTVGASARRLEGTGA